MWAASEFRSQGDASLSPLSVGVPKREVEASYGDTAKFQCDSAGEAELRYETAFSWVFRATSVEGRETLINATTDDSGDVVFDCTGPETPQPTPAPTYISSINPNLQRHLSVTASLNPGRDGGDGGGISLYPNDRGTLVIVDAKGTPDGAPVTLNKDGCTATGALVAGLNPTLGGESITQVDLSLADLLSGAYAVNVGVSQAAPDKNMGCGVISRGQGIHTWTRSGRGSGTGRRGACREQPCDAGPGQLRRLGRAHPARKPDYGPLPCDRHCCVSLDRRARWRLRDRSVHDGRRSLGCRAICAGRQIGAGARRDRRLRGPHRRLTASFAAIGPQHD